MGTTTNHESRSDDLMRRAVGSLPRVRERREALELRLSRVVGLLEAQKRHKELIEQQLMGLVRRIGELEELSEQLDSES